MIILSLIVIRMRLELKIVNLLSQDIKRNFTINGIAKSLKEHYSFVYRVVNRLIEDSVIVKTKVGKYYLCSLNLRNEKTLALLQLSKIERKEEFYGVNKKLKLILKDFVRTTQEELKNNLVAVILFGSFARGIATKESDIDVLLVGKKKPKVERIVKEIYAKYGREIAVITMTPKEFRKQKEKPIIKEIMKDHYVLYGAENFVNLVFENES